MGEDGGDEGVEERLGGRGAAVEEALRAHGADERADQAAALALQDEDRGEGDAGGVDLVGDLADVDAQQRDLGGERDGVGGAGHGVGVDAEGGVRVGGRRVVGRRADAPAAGAGRRRGAARPAAAGGHGRGAAEAAERRHLD
jgi:hypothetical protein